ncbi:MAG: cellulose binding domain-containing protein [Bacteroidota bacterium]
MQKICDSVVTVHVTINYPSAPTSFNAMACSSYVLPWETTVTVSGNYTHTYPNINGCDSVVTAHVIINYPSEPTSFNATACSSYTLPWGTTVTISGNYVHVYRNAKDCDSVVTAHITINYPSTPTSFSATACGSYTLPWGPTVTASNNYVHIYTNTKGCDSVVTAHITIYAVPGKPVISYTGATTFYAGGSITWSAPAGYASYLWSNNAATSSIPVTQSGNYTVKVTNNNSCSSLVSDAVQVTVLASPVSVSHLDGDNGQLTNNNIRPYLQLNNESNSAVAYKDITIRYWLTVEDFAPLTTNLVVDWAQLGTNKVKMKYVKLGQPCQGAYGYIEYSFDATTGNLAGGSNSGPIQSRAGKNDWTNFNEADDHSYVRNTSYTKNNKITVYKNGVRVWGTEPALITPVQSLKMYSQDKSSGATTNSISNWVKLNNEGNTPVSYKDITVRYWFTADGNKPLNYYLDYAQMGSSNIKWKFVKLSPCFPGSRYLSRNRFYSSRQFISYQYYR